MHISPYKVLHTKLSQHYLFVSKGPQGSIMKKVQFEEIDDGIFNIEFGDLHPDDDRIVHSSRTNNGDAEKVLATVAFITLHFLEQKPRAILYSKGETPSKTRLYQLLILKHWNDIQSMVRVIGFIDNKWEPFERGKNYTAFAVRKHESTYL